MPSIRVKSSRQIHPISEVLLKNIVDQDIQSLLAPMGFMYSIFLLPKYNIRDNFITPNGFWLNLTCFAGLCLSIGILISNTLCTEGVAKTETFSFLYRSLILDFICFSLGFVLNCIVSILYSKSYVQLILKMQESHRSLFDRKFQSLVKRNWLYTILLVSFHLSNAIFAQLIFFDNSSTISLLCSIVLLTFDFNLFSAIRLMIFIAMMLELWVKKFRLYSKVTEARHGKVKSRILWRRMYKTYSRLMESYNLVIKVYQWLILYHVAGAFFHSLIYVQVLIEFTKFSDTKWDHNVTYDTAALVNVWLLKNLVLHSTLAIVFERFYLAQADAEDACSMVEAQNATDYYKKLTCKNVRRLRSSEAVKFKLCRLFLIDAKYPLRLLSLISTYTIVLLQFGYQ